MPNRDAAVEAGRGNVAGGSATNGWPAGRDPLALLLTRAWRGADPWGGCGDCDCERNAEYGPLCEGG